MKFAGSVRSFDTNVAVAFGWRPAGTLYGIADLSIFDDRPNDRVEEIARREREWAGSYVTNDWQRVTDVDALALAAALYKAIAAIERGLELTPDQNEALTRMETEEDDFPYSSRVIQRAVDPASLARIADFVSKGGFEIG